MALETANVTFYKIKQCGYYAFGEDIPSFGGAEKLFKEVREWSNGKSLVETKLYEQAGDLLPVYLLDIKELDGSWMLTMWNQVPSTKQNVASVMANSSVGQAAVVMNDIKEGSIPGFATYFWVHPEQNIFASLRFQHLVTAQKAMQEYLEAFLEVASSHVVSVPAAGGEAGIEIKGYCENRDDVDEETKRLYPRFRTKMVRRPGLHDLILKKSDQVTRVERATVLNLDRPEDLEAWQKFLRWTKINQPQVRPDKMRINYRLATAVTYDDVRAMIQDWKEGAEREWDDYGFVFRGSSEIHWLSHSLARVDQELDVERDNDEVVNSMSLLRALHPVKAQLMKLAQT